MSESDNKPVFPNASAESEPTPVPDAPEVQDAVSDEQNQTDSDAPEVNSPPVSAVPTPGALSDPLPEQTDNRERPEDGPQDVSQNKKDVLSEDETPDVVA